MILGTERMQNQPVTENLLLSSSEEIYQATLDNPANDSVYPLGRDYWSRYETKPQYSHFEGESLLGVYVHFPFCVSKCDFCPLETFPSMSIPAQDAYADAVVREIELYAAVADLSQKTYYGFDIGGGTPTLLTARNIEKIWHAAMETLVHDRTSPDWLPSIETTAALAARQYHKMKLLVDLGFWRLSMGIQTTETRLLGQLNRASQSTVLYEEAMNHCRKAGFRAINVDIMYGLPGQSLDSFQENVEYVAGKLRPESVTVYETRYYRTLLPCDNRPSRHRLTTMYRRAYERLLACGYHGAYGSSYFSSSVDQPACSSYLLNRHIKCRSFIGLGAGAQGLGSNKIYFNYLSDNGSDAELYIRKVNNKTPIQFFYEMPQQEMVARYISLSLYFHGLIDCSEVSATAGLDLREEFKESLEFAFGQGLLSDSGDQLQITERGFENRYGIIALFYPPEARRVLVGRLKKQTQGENAEPRE